jgi:AcrR family transcriptional regulator
VSKPRTLAPRPRDTTRPHDGATPDTHEDSSRERIHQSALRLFSRYGYDGVSLQMIADDVGLHKSSLFHHYTGKLELMSDAVQDVISRLLSLLQPFLAQHEEPSLETLYDAMMHVVDHFSEQPDDARLLVTIMTAPKGSEVARLASDARTASFYVQLSQWLESARARGIIRRTSIRQTIPNLVGIILFYPAVANELSEVVGPSAFSPRAREIRKDEVVRLLKALFVP